MPGISAVSPPISAQPACRQPSAMPADDRRALIRVELAGGEIVEEEQRLGALHDQVVDAHGDEVDADRVVPAGVDGDLQLGADAVIGRDQHRIGEARGLKVEEPAEAADLAIRAWPPGRAHQRFDLFDQQHCRRRCRPRLSIGEPVFLLAHRLSLIAGMKRALRMNAPGLQEDGRDAGVLAREIRGRGHRIARHLAVRLCLDHVSSERERGLQT